MAKPKKNQIIYDYAIIDSGVCGRLIAYELAKKSHSVVLLETREALGPQRVFVETSKGRLKGHLEVFPETNENRELLNWFGEVIHDNTTQKTYSQSPVTVESGKLVPFMGFGDKKFQSIDQVSYYNFNEVLPLSCSPEEWILQLDEIAQVEKFSGVEVTSIEVEEDKIANVTINGDKTIFANNFVYCGSIKEFAELIPIEAIPAKVRQRIAKTRTWSTVSMHIEHNEPMTDNYSLHFLMGSKTDFEPCIGRFFEPSSKDNNEKTQYSIWFSLVETELVEDPEHLGSVLRNMKRQIKRAYENLFDSVKNEKIVVDRESHAHFQLGLKSEMHIPSLNNLTLASSQLATNIDFLGEIEMAQKTINSLSI